MKAAGKMIGWIGFLCLLIIIGLFLPEWMVQYSDRKTSGIVKLEPLALSRVGTSKHSVLDRLNLLQHDPHDVDKVALEMSANFDSASANAHFMSEIAKLSSLQILPPIDWGTVPVFHVAAGLYTLKADQSSHAILWNIAFAGDSFSGNFVFDDATGKVITFKLSSHEYEPRLGEATIEAWGNYLDLEVRNIRRDTTDATVMEDDGVKVSEDGYQTYYFNLGAHDQFVPATFYMDLNSYGFDDVSKWTLIKEEEIAVIIRKKE
ncbi:hypothetical protein [Paenibacillus sp. 598K]|uniref:hypothetical protein n=1 Tax=Paenibacillus sp. 598K TaxID=1117987 RepID=UPI000FFF5F0E|nr:hypothetical protein [Paenibacillus sp. 598K]